MGFAWVSLYVKVIFVGKFFFIFRNLVVLGGVVFSGLGRFRVLKY